MQLKSYDPPIKNWKVKTILPVQTNWEINEHEEFLIPKKKAINPSKNKNNDK